MQSFRFNEICVWLLGRRDKSVKLSFKLIELMIRPLRGNSISDYGDARSIIQRMISRCLYPLAVFRSLVFDCRAPAPLFVPRQDPTETNCLPNCVFVLSPDVPQQLDLQGPHSRARKKKRRRRSKRITEEVTSGQLFFNEAASNQRDKERERERERERMMKRM